jgi:predicted DNA-binding protein (MmcQ/YjbR family)
MIEELRTYCLSLAGTTEDMKWGDHLTFCVGLKMYVIFGLDNTPINTSIKVSEEDFEYYCKIEGIKPAPYLAKNKWISIDDLSLFTEKQWQEIIFKAYTIIKGKLTKKLQKEIDEL